jgi:hypothetical protein
VKWYSLGWIDVISSGNSYCYLYVSARPFTYRECKWLWSVRCSVFSLSLHVREGEIFPLLLLLQ